MERKEESITKLLLSGACAGVVSRTATNPLERLKIIRQINPTYADNRGTFMSLVQMYQKEGISSLWKGNFINSVRIAPYNAIQFTSFTLFKSYLPISDKYQNLFISSSLAGMISVLTCYPLDVIRSYISVDIIEKHNKKQKRATIYKAIHAIQARKGFTGFYQGLTASLIGIVPYVGLNLASFELLRERFQPDKSTPWFDMHNFMLGGISATFSTIITYPLELIRRKIQLSGLLSNDQNTEYKNYIDCIRKIKQNYGWIGFYSGLSPCLWRVIPAMSIVMLVNERMKLFLEDILNKDN